MKNGLPPDQVGVTPPQEPRRDGQLFRLLRLEWVEAHGHGVRDPARPSRTVVQELVAAHRDHQQGKATAGPDHVLDQVEEVQPGRLHVLQHHHHRSLSRQPVEELLEARPDLGRPIAMALPPLGLHVFLEPGEALAPHLVGIPVPILQTEAEGQPESAHHALDFGGRAASGHQFLQAVPHDGGRGVPVHTQLAKDHLGERGERDVFFEVAGAARQDLDVVVQAGHELVDQPALPDARLPQDRQQMSPAALPHPLERVDQDRQLAPAADQGDGPARGPR